jgi:hypothetical protein
MHIYQQKIQSATDFWESRFFRFFVTISRSGIHPHILTTNWQLSVFVEYIFVVYLKLTFVV